MTTLITLIISFISTNIDDIFLLTILFSQVGKQLRKTDIVVGQFIGIGFLVLVSIVTSYGLSFLSAEKIGWLGIVPIILGVKTWLDYRKEEAIQTTDEIIEKQSGNKVPRFICPQLFNVAVFTMANGADNLGIYIPLFNQYSTIQILTMIVVFSIMILIWCYLGYKLANLPIIRDKLEKYKQIVVPIVFIALGLFILIENYVLF